LKREDSSRRGKPDKIQATEGEKQHWEQAKHVIGRERRGGGESASKTMALTTSALLRGGQNLPLTTRGVTIN